MRTRRKRRVFGILRAYIRYGFGVGLPANIMETRPSVLYHGSSQKIEGALRPEYRHAGEDHLHTKAAVFATARKDLAAVFMFPFDHVLASIGFEQDVAYICIWGSRKEFSEKDRGGYVYELPTDGFEKVGKEYEWQSFGEVVPSAVEAHVSVIDGIMRAGAQVYFIDDEGLFDDVVAQKTNRAPILATITSENEKAGMNEKAFRSEM